MNRVFTVLLAAIMLNAIPAAAATQFQDTIDIRQRAIDAFTINLDNPAAGNLVTRNITMDQPYTFDQVQHTVIVFISITVTFFENDDGVWVYTVANEDGPIDDCTWELETTTVGGFLAGESTKYPPFGVTCLFRESTKAFPHDHTFILNRTILTGTPQPPTHESISIYFESEDVIILDTPTPFEQLTNLTAYEFAFIFALLLFGLWLWGREDFGVRFFGATLVVLDFSLTLSFFVASQGTAWPLFMVLLLTMFALAFWMYYGWFKDYALRRRGTL